MDEVFVNVSHGVTFLVKKDAVYIVVCTPTNGLPAADADQDPIETQGEEERSSSPLSHG